MPVFYLNDEIWFPDPEHAEPDGLVAVGGRLTRERLMQAYSKGIFPWYSQEPVLWFNPDPRMVLFPGNFKVSKSLKKTIRKNIFQVTWNMCFEDVIYSCARTHQHKGTWITPDIINAYIDLHNIGMAKSVECWYEGELVGGLYGVIVGGVFCGESMFHKVKDASKVALVHLMRRLEECGYILLDAQVYTKHLASFGAGFISRDEYLKILQMPISVKEL